MDLRKVAHIITVCLIVCLLIGWCADKAFAAAAAGGKAAAPAEGGKPAARGGKTDLSEKKGIEGLFKGKGLDEEKKATKAQTWLGLGSIVVMIIVVKYL